MSVSSTIKTIIHNKADHTLSLQQRPPPTPAPNQYLIKVHSTCFTAGELEWPEANALTDPIPCYDFAGTVLAIPTTSGSSTSSSTTTTPDQEVEYHKVGTRVFGLSDFERHGNAREITVATHKELLVLPDSISFNTATTIPLSALTASQALFEHAGLVAGPEAGPQVNAGKRLLVTAAAGGVGSWLVQLASLSGVHVTGTCSSRNIELVRGLGAKEVLDYNKDELIEWVGSDAAAARQFDVVIDCVGGATLEQCWRAVRNGGVLTSITQAAKPEKERPDGIGASKIVRTFYFIIKPDSNALKMIIRWVEQGVIRPQVDSVWSLEDYQGAWERVKGGHVSGKVVLQLVP